MRQSIVKLFRRHARKVAASLPNERAEIVAMVVDGVVKGHRRQRLALPGHRMRGRQTAWVRKQLGPVGGSRAGA